MNNRQSMGQGDPAPAAGGGGLLSRHSVGSHALRFITMSGTSALLTMGLPILLHELGGVPPEAAVAIAFACVFLVNFFMLRSFVFASKRSIVADFLNFGLSSIAFRGAEYVAFLILHSLLGLYYVLALGLTLVTFTIVKFLWYRRTMHERPA